MTSYPIQINKIYKEWSGKEPDSVKELTPAGSSRQYFRVKRKGHENVVATLNADEAEINSFVYLANHLREKGIKVPEVLAVDVKNHVYLQEDIGDVSLFTIIERNKFRFDPKITQLFTRVLKDLVQIQVQGHTDLDYSKCYPVSDFDASSMLFDLSYFREYFLKPLVRDFNEIRLEKEFGEFAKWLAGAESNYFMFRDFQSRNIFIKGQDIYYIDFQGGRRGALQYDPASLINQSRLKIPCELRELYLDYYLTELEKVNGTERKAFMQYYPGFTLLRLLQNMGAYGFRGMVQGKSLFIKSISPAMDNLKHFVENDLTLNAYPEMKNCLEKLVISRRDD